MAALFLSTAPSVAGDAGVKTRSVRKERSFIRQGNSLYEKGRYREAARKYSEAVDINPESAVGRYNLGLAQIKQCNPTDTTASNRKLLQIGVSNLQAAAQIGFGNVRVSTLACYNLGNLAFNQQNFDQAIQYYRQALRLNPADDNARRNLRIAQLKKQNQDKNKDKNQDQNKDQNKDQDQNKDHNKDQNKDQQQNKDQNKDQQPPRQNEKDINPQTADQILRAVENKENQTRQRVMGNGQGKESKGRNSGRKNW